MPIDRLRLAESGTEAALVLGALVLPRTPLPHQAVALALMFVILTSSVYALHAVTFDCLRLTGQSAKRDLPYTQSKGVNRNGA